MFWDIFRPCCPAEARLSSCAGHCWEWVHCTAPSVHLTKLEWIWVDDFLAESYLLHSDPRIKWRFCEHFTQSVSSEVLLLFPFVPSKPASLLHFISALCIFVTQTNLPLAEGQRAKDRTHILWSENRAFMEGKRNCAAAIEVVSVGAVSGQWTGRCTVACAHPALVPVIQNWSLNMFKPCRILGVRKWGCFKPACAPWTRSKISIQTANRLRDACSFTSCGHGR